MRLALVVDQPGQIHFSTEITKRALSLLGLRADIVTIAATSLTGSKKPGIVQIRDEQDGFWAQLERLAPDKVLAMGGIALTQMERAQSLQKITEARGIMRMATSPTGWSVAYVPTGSAGGIITYPDMYRDLVDDLGKVLTQDSPRTRLDRHDGRVTWRVENEPSLAVASLRGLLSAKAVSCDIETTGFSAWSADLLQVGFGQRLGPDRTDVVILKRDVLRDPDVLDAMWDVIFSTTHWSVLHNGKFDLQFLLRLFDETRAPMGAKIGDTMLLHHMLDERPVGKMAGSVHALKTLARVYYDEEDYSWDHAGWQQKLRDGTATDAEWEDFDWYHARDCHFTIQLWHDLREEAESPTLLAHHDELLGQASMVIAEAELRGAPIDEDALTEMRRTLEIRSSFRASALNGWAEAGGHTVAIGSTQSVWTFLYEDLDLPVPVTARAGGKSTPEKKSTDEPHLQTTARWCEDNGKPETARWIRELLAWRADQKSLGTYVMPLLESTRHDDGLRVHASFWLAGTATGRLSSSAPNLQNIPARRGENVRDTFKARPGFKWVEVDYSQLELRVAASLSGDPFFIRLFKEGHDVHREVAATIFRKAPEDVTKAERFIAKSIDFGVLYGRTAWAIANDEGIRGTLLADGREPIDQTDADAFITQFLSSYPYLTKWLNEQQSYALERGYVEVGRRRRRFLYQNRDKGDLMARKHMSEIRRQAMNSPIQGTASDITLDAMCRIADRLPEGAELLFPVHDSICFHIATDVLAESLQIITHEMETTPSWFNPREVPYVVEAKIGETWGTTE